MTRKLHLVAVLLVCLAPAARAEPMILCGDNTVFVVDTAQDTIEKVWTWKAKQCEQLPAVMRGTFATTDDCKPVDGGCRILVSSSSGGCALVERPSGKVIWYARAPNAHSLELLPRGRIAVASSVHANGNRLILFDLARSDKPIWDASLVSAHGVVWDEGRQLLWALGLNDLWSYQLQDWDSDQPSLAVNGKHPLPDADGHDLQPVPGGHDLVVTTGRHVYLFDRDASEFRLHPELGQKARVKSVSIHPVTGRTAFVQASDKAWWTDSLSLLSPTGTIQLSGERLYKARWLSSAGSR